MPRPRPGVCASKFAGRMIRDSCSSSVRVPSWSKVGSPSVTKSTTESKIAAVSAVIPKPLAAEFSPFAITASSLSSRRSSGTRACTALQLAGRITSPMNSKRKSFSMVTLLGAEFSGVQRGSEPLWGVAGVSPALFLNLLLHDRVYQGHKYEEVGNFSDLYGRPAQPFALFLHCNDTPVHAKLFDLVPGNQLFTIAYSLHAHAQWAEGNSAACLKCGDDLRQLDASHHFTDDVAQSFDVGNPVVEHNLPTIKAANSISMLCARINAVHIPPGDALPHGLDLVPAEDIEFTTSCEGKTLRVDIDMPRAIDERIEQAIKHCQQKHHADT